MARTASIAAPLKSALRLAKRSAAAPAGTAPAAARPGRSTARAQSPEDIRHMMLSEFTAWLEARVSPKTKRAYQGHTIGVYVGAGATLGRWMTEQKIDGDFADSDATTLNRFLGDYFKSHTQGRNSGMGDFGRYVLRQSLRSSAVACDSWSRTCH